MDERRGPDRDEPWPTDGSPGFEDRSAVDTASLFIGAIAHAVQKAGPETTEHLVKAGHEVMLAVRSFIRHVAEAVTEGPGTDDRDAIEHIPITGSPSAPRPREVASTEPYAGPVKDQTSTKASTAKKPAKKSGVTKSGADKPRTKKPGTGRPRSS